MDGQENRGRLSKTIFDVIDKIKIKKALEVDQKN